MIELMISDEQAIPSALKVAASWSWRLIVIGAAGYFLILGLAHYWVLVAPVLIAILLTALTRPICRFLMRWLPRYLAALLTVLGVIASVVGLIALVGTRVVDGFPELQRQAEAGLIEIQGWLAGPPLNLTTGQFQDFLAKGRESLVGNQTEVLSGALAATTTVGHIVAGIFITLFSLYFFLAQGSTIWGWFTRLLPDQAEGQVDRAGRTAWGTLTAFVWATVAVALSDAIGIGLGAALLGVPLALPLGVLVFLGAFIPIVGALISGSVAVLIALVAVGPLKALLMLIVVIAIQQLESHVLQPFLLGRAVRVHPLAVILGIAAGAISAGILGALFAVPLIATANSMILALVRPESAHLDPVTVEPAPE